MLKNLYPAVLAATLALTGLGANAQIPKRSADWCGAAAERERYLAATPGALAREAALNQQLNAMAAQQLQQRGAAYVTDVTIPVVVHIIHTGGTDNISDRQINTAINKLNEDYQRLNPDTTTTLPLFQPVAASIGFRFRLAKLDPNGNCTTGITRHYEPTLVNDDGSGAIHAVSNWDRTRYMNIWVVNTIGINSGGPGTVVGYVSTGGPTNPRDGFTVRNDFFGNTGTSNSANEALRAGTHEIGHYFSLIHPWGQTNNPGTGDCTGTDFVADTPPTDGTFLCNLAYAPCGPIANVQNFMDYASCANMFTQGQRTRMRNYLTTVRTALTTPANLVSTGTNNGYVAPNCAPIAAFGPIPGARTKVCINTPVTLRDYSYNFTGAGGQLTYTWSAPGATFVGPVGQSVTLSYPTAGIYSVTETVSNTVGSNSSTQTNLIVVEGPTGGETGPYAESFENASFPNFFAAPSLRNYETNGVTGAGAAAAFRWVRQATLPAANGSAYLLVPNSVLPANAVVTLITPNINLAGVTAPAVLRFARAHALRNANSNEQLRVSFSNDCGTNWSSPTVFNVSDLTTQGLTPITGFVPASAADWQDLTVAIPAQFQGNGLFKVRLQMVNGSTPGNGFYFDNLRVANALGTKADALAARGISVFPNPLTNQTAVHLTLATATQVQLRLTDVLGRDVLTLPAKTYGAGPLALPLQTAGRPLRAGLYVVRITLDGETFSSKLTVE